MSEYLAQLRLQTPKWLESKSKVSRHAAGSLPTERAYMRVVCAMISFFAAVLPIVHECAQPMLGSYCGIFISWGLRAVC